MIRQSIRSTILRMMLFSLLLAGCRTTSSELTSPPATASLPSETPPRATVTPGAALATTVASPTVPSPTLPSATPKPTLSAEQRESRILELLQTNGGCELPCWWGILPGTTTWSQTQAFLEGIGVRTSVYRTSGNTNYHGTGGLDFEGQSIYNRVEFIERDGIVEEIEIGSFSASSTYRNNPSGWLETWAGYSPKQIISKYGAPDRVWLMTSSQFHEPPGGSQMPYELWLFYDRLKFQVRYDGIVGYAPVYRFCPEFGKNAQLTAGISLYLADPAKPTPLETLSNTLSIPGMEEYIKPVEKATGLTIEQFSRLFTQSGKEACFDAPRNIWP